MPDMEVGPILYKDIYMKVHMKRYEDHARSYASHFGDWEKAIVSKDAYLAGYKQAKEDIKALWAEGKLGSFLEAGEELVEKEFLNGSHQLGIKSTDL